LFWGFLRVFSKFVEKKERQKERKRVQKTPANGTLALGPLAEASVAVVVWELKGYVGEGRWQRCQ
jgi:hypothetical protein